MAAHGCAELPSELRNVGGVLRTEIAAAAPLMYSITLVPLPDSRSRRRRPAALPGAVPPVMRMPVVAVGRPQMPSQVRRRRHAAG